MSSQNRSHPLNILLICTDQERNWVDIPSALPLPAHERLLTEGIGFENYHVNVSPCGPSRSVIYTGQHTQHTGLYVNPNTPPQPELSADFPTIGDMLREQGYYTAYKGKWHLSNINEGKVFRGTASGIYPNASDVLEPFGFSDYNFDGERTGLTWEGFMEDGPIAAEAARFLFDLAAGKTAGKPWFLAVNFVNPHDIMFFDATGHQHETRAHKDFLAPLLPEPGAAIYQKTWDFPLPESFYRDDLSHKPECHRAIRDGQVGMYGVMEHDDEPAWQRFQNYYFNCLRDVDQHVMWLLDVLDMTGLADRTIVLYTSDHGERAGAHGLKQKAGTMYKEDMNVPLIVRHPDCSGGRTTSALAAAIDVVPTLLAWTGTSSAAERYPALTGVDLSAALETPGAQSERDRRGILFNYAAQYGWARTADGMDLSKRRAHRGIHDGRYKFARYFAPAQHHQPKDWETLTRYNDLELYDTETDPHEIVNLAHEPERYQQELLRLNTMTNALIDLEIGADHGAEYPGPVEQYNTI